MNQLDSHTKVIHILKFKLKFSKEKVDKLSFFADSVIKFNKKYNLISKSSEKNIWSRHILDSAQLVKFIDFSSANGVSDLGSGAGFPGIVLGIYNPNYTFHVKLYEKSSVKCAFLRESIDNLKLKINVIEGNVNSSAQLVKFIDFSSANGVSDLGSGAGFPGIVLGIYNPNYTFHVKLYEKSSVKCAFLRESIDNLKLKINVIEGNVNSMQIDSNYVVCRAFKKIPELLRISRENIQKPNKLIILKGKTIEPEAKNAFIRENIRYKIFESITEVGSKILIIKN